MFGALLEVEMSKKSPPLWREAHLQVKKLKTPHVRNTFGSWDVEKVHAVVARSTCRSQNVQNTPCSDHFWKLMLKSARSCGAKQISKSKCTKHHMPGPLLDVQMSLRVAGARDWGHCSISKNDGRRGTFEEDLQRCIFRGRRSSTREVFIRDVRRSGRWFPERGCILEHQIFRFAKMILRDRCKTSYDLASLFSCQAQYFRQVEWKNRKTHWYEAVSSALNFPFLKEVSQNCFVFDVFNFEKWGSLAELFRFGWCQVPKLRKSRRLASFWMLSSSKIEEVSQNSCAFKLADRQTDRQIDR